MNTPFAHNAPPVQPPVSVDPMSGRAYAMQPMQGAGWGEPPEPEIDVMEYVRLVWGKKWLVVAVLVASTVLSAAWTMTRPKMFRSSVRITVEPAPRLSSSEFDSYLNFWQMDRYIADQIEVLRTRSLAQRVVDRMGLDAQEILGVSNSAAALAGRLQIEQIGKTDVVELSMVGEDSERIAQLLNVYVEEFVAANIEDSLERTRRIYTVIQSRLDPLKQQVQDSETAMLEFREREDALLFAEEDKNVITEQVNTLTTEYAQAKAERIRLETKLAAIRNVDAGKLENLGFPEILRDETMRGLRQERASLMAELTEKLRTYREGHPVIKELRSRIAGFDDAIQNQMEVVRRSLQSDYDIVSRREQSLFSNIQQLREESIQLSKQSLEYDSLRRDYEQNKSFLEDMLARSKEADLSATGSVNNIRVIEPAVPAMAPYTPNVPRGIGMGAALGLFLGIGLVLGLDFLDHTVRTPSDVERYLGQETLATLPIFTEENSRVLREAFQSLRTALMLASRGEGCHVLMITSAVPSEGKTTVSFNMAKVLATGGARVLLIDADLRKPRLHRMIKVKNISGLTTVVLGESKLSEVVHSVADVPSMHLMTSGPLPPNPPEVFGKLSYRRLLEHARESYDWVIIDTPPVASVTDPVICSSLADMVLMVVQYGKAKRQVIAEGIKLLSRAGTRMSGVLLNKVDVERDRYYYSYYYSYYNYGNYGVYGDEAPSKKAKKSRGKVLGD